MKLLLCNGAPALGGLEGDEERNQEAGRTVVVGVKLDKRSRELLTWVLVKVAESGDRVLALHVIDKNDIVDKTGKAWLLSLVQAFDSILAVYEGFCNLKQVDLKLKICRGHSVREILVREATLYYASILIVGISKNRGPLKSPASIAKYCAKRVHKDCRVLAVSTGKIVYRREGYPDESSISKGRIESDYPKPSRHLDMFHQSMARNLKVSDKGGGDSTLDPSRGKIDGTEDSLKEALSKVAAFNSNMRDLSTMKCAACSAVLYTEEDADNKQAEAKTSLAFVPSSLVSTVAKKLPEQRPGWPLLSRVALMDRMTLSNSSPREISVVQWAMRLPSRRCLFPNLNSDNLKQICARNNEHDSAELDGESGAIVHRGHESMITYDEENLRSLPKELEGLHEKYSSTCWLFKYNEIIAATSNFSEENLVGKGGCSRVYKGQLQDGKEIAVKILKKSDDVLKEFVLEIEILTALNHKNVISLIGFCYDADQLLLVYDLLARGSLEENLYGSKRDPAAFGWEERYKVAVGIAEALHYLHSRDDRLVIHRDVKSSNILLSDDFEPQLSDFGLAKWALTSSTYITCTDIAGTFGYLAPEYFIYGKVNDKIDVYAFGVVLLELLSGRKPISNDFPKGQESLVMWAKPILNGGKVLELLDPSLGYNYDHDKIERMILAATLCIRRTPRARPQMSIVLKLLLGAEGVINWANLQVRSSEENDLPLDDEILSKSNLQSHLNLAFTDMEDDSLSVSIIEHNVSLEDYLRGRCIRSSSFD